MTGIRPGQPTPTPRPGTGPKMTENEQGELVQSEPQKVKKDGEKDGVHAEEMSREEVESEMPADPDPDDPVSPR